MTLVEMGAVTGGCERLLSTPMPLSYTRFTGRALMLWLFALPLGLWPLLGWATPASTFLIACAPPPRPGTPPLAQPCLPHAFQCMPMHWVIVLMEMVS